MSVRDKLGGVAEAAAVWAGRFGSWRRMPPDPRVLGILITHRCRNRCVMCGLWRLPAGPELRAPEWAGVLADPLFRRVRYLGINGGEPFLRPDLAELAATFLKTLPGVRRMSVVTSGLLPEVIAPATEGLSETCSRRGTMLSVTLSVHATGAAADEVMGVPGAFGLAEQTLDALEPLRRAGRLSLALNAVLLKRTLGEADALLRWARERRLPLSFVLGERRERFANPPDTDPFLGVDDQPALIALLERLVREGGAGDASSLRYRDLLRVVRGGERTLSCHYAFGGALLGPDGGLFYCPHGRRLGDCRTRPAGEVFRAPENLAHRRDDLLGRECLRCPPYTLMRVELARDLHRFAWPLLRGRLGRGRGAA